MRICLSTWCVVGEDLRSCDCKRDKAHETSGMQLGIILNIEEELCEFMNTAYERKEKEVLISWDPRERNGSGAWGRKRQEGKSELGDMWQRDGVPSCYRSLCSSRPSSDLHLS